MEQDNKYEHISSHRHASWRVLQASYTSTLYEVGAGEMLKGRASKFGAYHFKIGCPHILAPDTARHIGQILCLSWCRLGWCILSCIFALNNRPCLQISGLMNLNFGQMTDTYSTFASPTSNLKYPRDLNRNL
jgi:hypothetical protein